MIARARFEYQATTFLNFRLVSQYHRYYDTLDIQPLISYQPGPFSIFYFGTSRTYATSFPGWKESYGQIYLKVQKLFSIQILIIEMISDIINIVTSLPSQHVIYGMISTVLCIAVAWVYGKCSQKIRLTILQAIGYLVIFNEVVLQIYMIYYGIWSPRS